MSQPRPSRPLAVRFIRCCTPSPNTSRCRRCHNMANAIVQLNPGPSSGGLPFATVQDAALTNHQKVVLELETGALPGPVTTANPVPVAQQGGVAAAGTVAS